MINKLKEELEEIRGNKELEEAYNAYIKDIENGVIKTEVKEQ